MRRDLAAPLPELRAPEGYTLREATLTDDVALASLLSESFGDEWDAPRVRQVLLEHPEVPRTFVVERDGDLAATASYQLIPGEWPEAGWVHFVGGAARHAGLGLGGLVTLRVMHEARAAGKREAVLTTDDWRLPAIRTYLKLGFEPNCWHESHAERWEAVRAKLSA